MVILIALAFGLALENLPVNPKIADRGIPLQLDTLAIPFLIANAVLIAILWLVLYRFRITGRPRWGTMFTGVMILSDMCLVLQAGVIAESGGYVFRLATASVWIGLAVSVLLAAPMAGRFRLALRRRQFTSRIQVPTYRSKADYVDEKIRRMRSTLKQRIRDGRMLPEKMTRLQRHVVRVLGLGRIRPIPRLIEERKRDEAQERARKRWQARQDKRRKDRGSRRQSRPNFR